MKYIYNCSFKNYSFLNNFSSFTEFEALNYNLSHELVKKQVLEELIYFYEQTNP